MLSMTGIVIERSHKKEFLERIHLASWPFFSSEWSTVHHLLVPALTLRERLFLERGILSKTPEKLVEELGFENASDINIKDFLDSYKRYYRFYPTLIAAEL